MMGSFHRTFVTGFAALSVCRLLVAQAPQPGPATPPSPPAPQDTTERDSVLRKAEAAGKSRAVLIDYELATLDRKSLPDGDWAKEWAGSYYVGDGTGMNVRIQVAPKSGLSYRWRGCLGTYGARNGVIETVYSNGLKIKFSEGPEADEMHFMTDIVYFVRWGDRRYLVPATKLQRFVDNFREGGFSRSAMFGIPRMDGRNVMGSWRESMPDGLPELPVEFMKQLRYKEVALKFTKVEELDPPERNKDSVVYAVILDGGWKVGVANNEVMTYRQGKCHGIVRIERVKEQWCSGNLFMFADEEAELRAPMVGATLKFLSPLPDEPAPEAAPKTEPK